MEAPRRKVAHEAYVDYAVAKLPSERSFGFTVGGILLAIAVARALFRGDGLGFLGIAFAFVGVLLIAGALLAPHLLRPLNRAWMRLGHLLGRVANPIIMGLLFLVGFVPTGFVMRTRGHDPLRRRFDRALDSYWLPRDAAASSDMRRQF